jgi:hypothetical protein
LGTRYEWKEAKDKRNSKHRGTTTSVTKVEFSSQDERNQRCRDAQQCNASERELMFIRQSVKAHVRRHKEKN